MRVYTRSKPIHIEISETEYSENQGRFYTNANTALYISIKLGCYGFEIDDIKKVNGGLHIDGIAIKEKVYEY